MNQNKSIGKQKRRRLLSCVNGTKGVISLFLAFLMLPFTTIACTLLDAARVNSAVAVFDEALCNASNSTLGTYDKFLKKRFGLLALSQDVSNQGINYTPEKLISETFKKYMSENLGAMSNVYTWADDQDTPDISGVYPLSDPDVLRTQIRLFSKYSVPTKLVADALSLEDWIKQLEKTLLGHNFFDFAAGGLSTADSLVSLGEDISLLKGKISTGNEALSKYETKYTEFSDAVSGYVNLKVEAERELAKLENQLAAANAACATLEEQVKEYDTVIEEKQAEIDELNELDEAAQNQNHLAEIEALQQEIDDLNEEADPLRVDLQSAENEASSSQTNLQSKRAEYEQRLTEACELAATKKGEYESAIGTLAGALTAIEKQIETVQDDIISLDTNINNTVSSGVEGLVAQTKYSNKKAIAAKKEEKKSAKESGDLNRANAIQLEIDQLEIDKRELEDFNGGKIISAEKDGINAGMNRLKNDLQTYDRTIYGTVIGKLNEVKDKVSAYDTNNISAYLDDTVYYYKVSGLMTTDMLEDIEKEVADSVTKASIWTVIEAIFSFVEAIFKINLFFDPALTAVLDLDYYNTNYHGMPGAGESYSKDRSVYPYAVGKDEDRDKSLEYKTLMGLYSDSSGAANNSFDVVECIKNILSNYIELKLAILDLANIFTILETGTKIKRIQTAWSNMTSELSTLFSYISGWVTDTAAKIGNKLLISGYAAYSTSDRTSRTGTNPLTQANYNMRAQETGVSLPYSFGDFQAILKTLDNANGTKQKCFFGAETEYLIWGSTYELNNQCAAFLVIFVTRIILNIYAVLMDPEVQAIASAVGAATFGIGTAVVYGLYFLLEAFIDTVLLVNSSDVEFFKTGVYLTIAGLPTLVSSFYSLLDTKGKEDLRLEIGTAEENLLREYGSEVDLSGRLTESYELSKNQFNRIKYSEMLLIIMTIFTPEDTILSRLSNIMEMEAVEYYSKQLGNNGTFDLDKSYTYLRVETSFKMNRFMPIDVDPILTSSNRLIYRGY